MKYGLNAKVKGLGYLETRFGSNRSLHEVKSLAGKAFHSDYVESVCVFDNTGEARLYLRKTSNGVIREER